MGKRQRIQKKEYQGLKPLIFFSRTHTHEKGGCLVSSDLSQPSPATPPSPATQQRSEREGESERGEAGGRHCQPSLGSTGITRASRDERRRGIEIARGRRGRTTTTKAEVNGQVSVEGGLESGNANQGLEGWGFES